MRKWTTKVDIESKLRDCDKHVKKETDWKVLCKNRMRKWIEKIDRKSGLKSVTKSREIK